MTPEGYSFECEGEGGEGGGGITASGWEAYLDSTGLPDSGVLVDDDLAAFDCRLVRCPDPRRILWDPTVIAWAESLYKLTKADATHREYGVFVFMNADGTMYVGSIHIGTPSSIPGMQNPPWNTVASIHTHFPGDASPSGWDSLWAGNTHHYPTVATESYLFLLDTSGAAGYVRRRPGAPGGSQ